MLRERVFICEFCSRTTRCVAHVCAWDSGEALDVFLAELRESGVDGPGQLAVTAPGGGPRLARRVRRQRH
jgi:hypothetical protein